MRKIDRLVWTAGISFSSYGSRIGVRSNDPGILKNLPDLFPPKWKPSTSAVVERLYSLIVGGEGSRPGLRRFNLLYADAQRLARTTNLDELLEAFESDLKIHVAERARRKLFVHAGVVGWRGRAIVIPGKSFSGKTTVVAELVRAGATYYSDEYAVFDSKGQVHPYERPMMVRTATDQKRERQRVESFGGRIGTRPLPVGLVLVSEYCEGARWRPRSLTRGEGSLALLSNTIAARRYPEKAFTTFERIARDALFIKSKRGEARAAAASILSLL